MTNEEGKKKVEAPLLVKNSLTPEVLRSRAVGTKTGTMLEVTVRVPLDACLMAVEKRRMYRFDGNPLDDVLTGDAIIGLGEVVWDNTDQDWIDVHDRVDGEDEDD